MNNEQRKYKLLIHDLGHSECLLRQVVSVTNRAINSNCDLLSPCMTSIKITNISLL